jgi:hypothetical protein
VDIFFSISTSTEEEAEVSAFAIVAPSLVLQHKNNIYKYNNIGIPNINSLLSEK